MQRTPMKPDFSHIPEMFHSYLKDCPVFDSSCSKQAQVFYMETDGGLFLKSAEAGSLKQEADMDAYFASLGLGPEVLAYHTGEKDWLLTRARENYRAGRYDSSLFPDNWGYASAEEAWAVIETNSKHLKTDTLLHGDFCLPNIMLDAWKPSGFIDVGGGGIGDRHVDLFWGSWTLNFNLKTDKYCQRFLDAYGREHFEPEMLRTIAAVEVFL